MKVLNKEIAQLSYDQLMDKIQENMSHLENPKLKIEDLRKVVKDTKMCLSLAQKKLRGIDKELHQILEEE